MTEKFRIALVVVGVLVGIALAQAYVINSQAEQQAMSQQRQQVVCPSFLSIARSARDTLIIMRNEPLCAQYVLDNLK